MTALHYIMLASMDTRIVWSFFWPLPQITTFQTVVGQARFILLPLTATLTVPRCWLKEVKMWGPKMISTWYLASSVDAAVDVPSESLASSHWSPVICWVSSWPWCWCGSEGCSWKDASILCGGKQVRWNSSVVTFTWCLCRRSGWCWRGTVLWHCEVYTGQSIRDLGADYLAQILESCSVGSPPVAKRQAEQRKYAPVVEKFNEHPKKVLQLPACCRW